MKRISIITVDELKCDCLLILEIGVIRIIYDYRTVTLQAVMLGPTLTGEQWLPKSGYSNAITGNDVFLILGWEY